MIYCIALSIYNEDLPDVPVPEEKVLRDAAAGSIRLVYDGGDDKFSPITASSLNFSLMVPLEHSQEDLYYDDLFTGNENRFKVVLTDQDNAIIWQGFLLPDVYKEPYTVGAFSVDFTATDGLGRLKGKELPASFYRAKHSVIKTIADCLKQTGLALAIYNDPAIINASGVIRWDQIFVNGAAWQDDNGVKDCYEILTDVLTVSGCTIFQKENKWYIVGINRRGVSHHNYDIYTKDGVFRETALEVFTPSIGLQWFSKPMVQKQPPFKEVKVAPGTNVADGLLPEDIVVQEFEFTAAGQSAPAAKYWSSAWHTVQLYDVNHQPFPVYDDETIAVEGVVGFENITADTGTFPTARLYYMTNDYTPYVKAVGEDIELNLSIVGQFPAVSESGFVDNSSFLFDVLIDDDIVFSNWNGFVNYSRNLLEFTNTLVEIDENNTVTQFTGVLSARIKAVSKSGFLTVKIYNVRNPNLGYTAISELKVSVLKTGNDTCTRRRDIDFTKKHSLDMRLGDSVQDLVAGALTVQPAFNSSEFTPMITSVLTDFYDSAGVYVGAVFALLSLDDYNYLIANITSIYLQRDGSDFKEFVVIGRFIVKDGLYYVSVILPDASVIVAGDTLYVREGVFGDPQDASLLLARESWQKSVGAIISGRIACVLADIYHSAYYNTVIGFEGNCEGLVFPGGHYAYDFAAQNRQWIVTRTELIFGKNESRVSILEVVNGTVIDYE